MSSKAARRYAFAYYETAREKNILEAVKDDVTLISDVLKASKDLRLFLKSPLVNREQKSAALLEIFDQKVDPFTLQLFKTLTDKNREGLLELLIKHFVDYYNAHHGIIEIDVKSAFELEADQIVNLKKQLETTTGKKVEMMTSTDSELIGGIMVRIEDTVIDGTIKHKLSQLKDRLTSAAVE